MNDPSLTVKDVCARLNCATSTLYRWMDKGYFPRPMHIGAMVRWTEADLEGFIRNADMKRKERGERGPRPTGIRRGRPSGSRNKFTPDYKHLDRFKK